MEKQEKSTKAKKPFYKKWWFFAIIGILLISVISGLGDEDDKLTNDSNGNSSIVETTVEDENTSVDETAGSEITEEPLQEEKLVFELIAGQQGEYGKMITYNKGTEFEENFYAFYIPAGTYIVTNTGKYMSQLNVYSDEIAKNDAGWEEPAETYFANLVDVNSSVTVTIKEGQHIEIAEPSNFKFEQQ